MKNAVDSIGIIWIKLLEENQTMGAISIYDSWEPSSKNALVIAFGVAYLGHIKELDASGHCTNEMLIFLCSSCWRAFSNVWYLDFFSIIN